MASLTVRKADASDRKKSSKLKSDTNNDQENSAPSNEAKESMRRNSDIKTIENASKPLEKRRSVTQNVKPMSPSQEMVEEQEIDDDYMPTSIPENVPWHHAQLYHLYGSNADYFLHPKLEPQPKKDVLPSKERLEGYNFPEGHLVMIQFTGRSPCSKPTRIYRLPDLEKTLNGA